MQISNPTYPLNELHTCIQPHTMSKHPC